jgi:hypothetical protein
MTWLKRNFVPLIMGLAFLAMIVLALFMLKEVRAQQIDAENRQRDLKEQLDKQMGNAIFPSPNNMVILQNQTKQLEGIFHEVYEALPKQTKEYPAMPPWEFKGYLETELKKLESYCRTNEVIVPPGISFGFGRYVGTGAPPKKDDTSALMHQLDLAGQFVRLLVQSKVVELTSLRRTYLDGETESGGGERVEGGMWKKDPHLLYESQNFEVTFRCNNDTLKTTLANLATSTNLLVLVRSISVDVPKVFPPTPVDLGAAGTPGTPSLPAAPQGRTVTPTPGIPNRAMPPGVPPPGGGRPAPGGRGAQTTQPEQSGAKGPAEVPLVLGTELATVTLRLDVLEIKTEEAKEDAKSAGKEPAKDAKKS